MGLTIYLAGAMDKVPPEFAITWRLGAKTALTEAGHKVYDPTADKDLWNYECHTRLYTPGHIVKSDLSMISKSDIILAEISRRDIPYHGTSMELVYAKQWQKRVYVWGGCKSYWVRYHADKIFETMEDAVSYILYGGDECENL